MPIAHLDHSCPMHVKCDGKLLEFLLITDQKDSSKIAHEDVKPKTERHFNEFIPILPKTAQVVKNIGDSLMVHVMLEPEAFPAFVLEVLKKKAELDTVVATVDETKRRPKVPIRIVMVYLDPNEFLRGQSLDWSPDPQQYNAEVPVPQTPACRNWLCGDLFGSNVALAFRASGIPKEDIVIVDDRIIKKWKPDAGNDSLVDGSAGQEFSVGPRLAFSPFKGLEEIYISGGDGPVAGSSWEGHLFMRMVELRAEKVAYGAENKLVLDQQRVRILTEVVWIGAAPLPECTALYYALTKKQNGSDYVRNVGRVMLTEAFPPTLLSTAADVILMGAYPSHEAYAVIRKELDDIREREVAKYAYPVTNEVYASPTELKTAFWVPGMLGEKYILLFARWRPYDRMKDKQVAENTLDKAIEYSRFSKVLRTVRCGLIQGNLWDVYALLSFRDRAASFKRPQLRKLKKAIMHYGFEAATLKLCESLLPEPKDNR